MDLASDEENKSIKRYKENRIFRFGNGIRFPSKQQVSVPIKLGKLTTELHVSVVDANIPLLIRNPGMKKLGLTINFEKDKVYTSRTGETFDLGKNEKGHLTLPVTTTPLSKETHNIMNLDECTVKEKEKKVHQILCHPREEVLKAFYRDSSENNSETLKLVEEVSRKCAVCLHHKRTPSRPKAGLPLSRTFNQCVAIDLKERRKNNTYIIHAIDTFSRLTRGKILKN